MANANSTTATSKPKKPRKDFPLFAHANGQWAKKVKGKFHYFGSWEAPQTAVDEWERIKEDLYAGRKPRPKREDGLPIHALLNQFIAAKSSDVDAGELEPKSYRDLFRECRRIKDYFGRDRYVEDLGPDDFIGFRVHLAEGRSKTTLGNIINRSRSVFNWAFDNALISSPVVFGTGFNKPSKRHIKRESNERGERIFEPDQIIDLVDAATPAIRVAILLGINTGIGNMDVGQMRFKHINLETGWLDYPRIKTSNARRAKLWPETVQAIRDYLEVRPKAKHIEHDDIVLLTRYFLPWSNPKTSADPISREVKKLVDSLELPGGLSYYRLRHTFRTVADEVLDQPAINLCMGHSDRTMGDHYRHRISNKRLEAVADVVHGWLYGSENAS